MKWRSSWPFPAGSGNVTPSGSPVALRAPRSAGRGIHLMTTFQAPRAGERMLSVEEAQERVLASRREGS